MKFARSLCAKLPSSPKRESSKNKSTCGVVSSSSSSDNASGRFGSSGRLTASGRFRITKGELEAALRKLGPDPLTDAEVVAIVGEIDCDDEGCISLDELEGAVGSGTVETGSNGRSVEELRDVFRVFDAEGDGKISAEELMGVFVALGDEACTVEECRRMIKGVDSDGDGFVCFRDFVRMMQ